MPDKMTNEITDGVYDRLVNAISNGDELLTVFTALAGITAWVSHEIMEAANEDGNINITADEIMVEFSKMYRGALDLGTSSITNSSKSVDATDGEQDD